MYSKSCYVKREGRSVGSDMLIADRMLTEVLILTTKSKFNMKLEGKYFWEDHIQLTAHHPVLEIETL